MEAILTILAIIVLSALSNLMRRRTPDEAPAPPAGSEEPWPAAPPPPTARPADQPASPSAPSRGFDWEKELRRLLEVGPAEEKPPPLPPPPAAPPPVIQPPPAALEPRAPRLRPRPAPAPAVRASTALPQTAGGRCATRACGAQPAGARPHADDGSSPEPPARSVQRTGDVPGLAANPPRAAPSCGGSDHYRPPPRIR